MVACDRCPKNGKAARERIGVELPSNACADSFVVPRESVSIELDVPEQVCNR
jgi:hypothetical protein